MDNKELTLSELGPRPGARRCRKRVGCGESSGHGKTSCRGGKGQTARSGGRVRRGFEGGQMPLHRRIPKSGFTSRKKVTGVNVYQLVAVWRLDRLAPTTDLITPEVLLSLGLIREARVPVKILGGGKVEAKMKVQAHAFSASAKKLIEGAGGEATLIA